jgi:hypothetical protein
MEFVTLLFLFIIGHAVADYPLQIDSMARGKNRNRPLDFSKIPEGQKPVKHVWVYWLSAHSLTHAGAVFIISQNIYLAFAEFIFHWIIDFLKCENYTTIDQDQALHILCKIAWCLIIFYG